MIEELVSELWQRARPTVAARLELLEAAARAAETGHMESELRDEAAMAAHKLAGSLGTYGIPAGSELASAIEEELGREPDADRLKALVADLRRVTGVHLKVG